MFADASSFANNPCNELSSAPPNVSARKGGTQIETSIVCEFGRDVAVAMACVGKGTCCVTPGLGIYMGAMLDSVGATGVARLDVQLEMSNAHRNKYLQVFISDLSPTLHCGDSPQREAGVDLFHFSTFPNPVMWRSPSPLLIS